MKIIKRDGSQEEIKLDKVTRRVERQSEGLKVDPIKVSQRAVSGLYDGVKAKEVDELLAETAAFLSQEHPDYSKLAGRIAVTSLHKETKGFYEATKLMWNPDPKESLLSNEYYDLVMKYGKKLEKIIDYDRDLKIDYFGFKTLENSYLLKNKNKKILERPQDMYMRVALFIARDSIEEVEKLYNTLSEREYTHATPTLYNAALKRPQLSSCFLMEVEDSIKGIYKSLSDCAAISQYAGGIGLHIHNVRGKGSYITGTGGFSNGIVPMLKVFNDTARYVDQGGGKRKGSFAVYIEPHHPDIEDFLEMKLAHGKEEMRARDLFYALWVSDLFMKRVEQNGDWSLFCPKQTPGLCDVYGDEFEKLYTEYESKGLAVRTIKAQDLWMKVLKSQIETGTPYILFKDSINKRSNQKNIGVIKSSNLCAEITEVSNPNETAVCNLASVNLPEMIYSTKKDYNFKKLETVVRQAVRNLNKVIDINYYPTEETKTSNMRHRPVGLGVQGLADVFFRLGIAYESEEARRLNKEIFETIYYAALKESNQLAKEFGAYDTFEGSPASRGLLQFDLAGETHSGRHDFDSLKKEIMEYGLRNSLLVALMPTASTASIFGNTESFEAQTSNIYLRSVLSGEFVQVNRYLVKDLEDLGLWNPNIRSKIIAANGSVQNIDEIPSNLKEIYKTVWEMSNKTFIDMARDRGLYVCQSQSMNLWMAEPNLGKLNSAIIYAWKSGLKTGMYYLRSKPKVDPVKLKTTDDDKKDKEALVCSLENPEACEACGS